MEIKSFMPYYASIIMFYHVNLACYHISRTLFCMKFSSLAQEFDPL